MVVEYVYPGEMVTDTAPVGRAINLAVVRTVRFFVGAGAARNVDVDKVSAVSNYREIEPVVSYLQGKA